MSFVVFQEIDDRWHWEMRLADARVLATSALGFSNIEQVFDAIRAVRDSAPDAPILNLLGKQQEASQLAG